LQSHVQDMSHSIKPDSMADWGWAPFRTLPSTTLAANSGGSTAIARPGAPAASHEMTSDEARLRGELARAIRKGALDRIRGLAGRGAPLNASFDLGYGERGNCIDWACVSGWPESALLLFELADERGQGDALAQGARAGLFWSVSQGYTEVVKQLLCRGADIAQHSPVGSLKVVQGDTLLAVAVFGGRKNETLELLRHGAWEKETPPAREQLLAWASSRKPVADAFREGGVYGFDKVLAPFVCPYRDQGIYEPDYPPANPINWEAEVPFASVT